MSLLTRLPAESLRLISLHLGRRVESCLYSTSPPSQVDKKAYSHTLRLPKTSFPLKHKNPVEVEAQLRRKISDELYIWQKQHNSGPPFVFLDGPPYANGNLHMGHALNKILKDFINRSQVLQGRKVHFEPGWDCHGLPIEQKALQIAGASHTALEPMRIREIARNTALEAIEIQKREMRDLGVMADWDNSEATYRTLDRDFEIRQLRLFQHMVEQGHITHRLRPCYYSPAARTALAESELKYSDDHESKSVFVAFKVTEADMSPNLHSIWGDLCVEGSEELCLAIWTTTPWTLASNLGVAVGNDLDYVIARTEKGQVLVIQADRLRPMEDIIGSLEVLTRLKGSDLVGTRYTHLFRPPASSKTQPEIIHSNHVSVESGTGLVHMAPVHGQEDYEAFAAAGRLPDDLHCPVDAAGRYDASLANVIDVDKPLLERLIGKEVLGSGNEEVITMLGESKTLLALQTIRHRYPYDWKTKTPTIIRATPQWFADVAAVKPRAVESLDHTHFLPPSARHRLESFITSRSEWCISRQRSWGVPIPVLFDSDDNPVTKYLNHTVDVLDRKGIDHWWTGPVEDFVPAGESARGLYKGQDTMDVWFDSGSAWTSIDGKFERSSEIPLADVCLEGSDQHRGWFQSSLLTRLITTTGSGPVAGALITHGFVMDEQGRKMSKSDGNGISPMDIVHGMDGQKALGADALRIWVASVDYAKDVSIGPTSISQAAEILRKIRSVMRFVLGNLSDTSVPDAGIKHDLLDQYVLHELSELESRVIEAYDQYAFSRALQNISGFAGSVLSSLYFDAIKDTLYCDRLDSPRRQAVIAVLREVLDTLLRAIAPLAPHLAEEINEAMPSPYVPSVFAAQWNSEKTIAFPEVKQDMEMLLGVRGNVQTLLEECRADKLLRQPAEADLHIASHGQVSDLLKQHFNLLPALFTTSSVSLSENQNDSNWARLSKHESYTLVLVPARHKQCPRCWLYRSDEVDSVCGRCAESLQSPSDR